MQTIGFVKRVADVAEYCPKLFFSISKDNFLKSTVRLWIGYSGDIIPDL
jgi:hypothetical protein